MTELPLVLGCQASSTAGLGPPFLISPLARSLASWGKNSRHCLPGGQVRPVGVSAALDDRAGPLAALGATSGVRGTAGLAAASFSTSNRYMPVVRSIFSRGPS